MLYDLIMIYWFTLNMKEWYEMHLTLSCLSFDLMYSNRNPQERLPDALGSFTELYQQMYKRMA